MQITWHNYYEMSANKFFFHFVRWPLFLLGVFLVFYFVNLLVDQGMHWFFALGLPMLCWVPLDRWAESRLRGKFLVRCPAGD